MHFTEYYQMFFTRIYNYARFRTSSDQEAEDLTAQIFAKLYNKYESFDSTKASLEVWSFMVARSATIDFLRKKKIRSWLTFFAKEDLPQTSFQEDMLSNELEEMQLLEQALQRLTDSERELLNLRYYQGLSQQQIAQVTGLSTSNVGVRIHRVVTKLKQVIGDIV